MYTCIGNIYHNIYTLLNSQIKKFLPVKSLAQKLSHGPSTKTNEITAKIRLIAALAVTTHPPNCGMKMKRQKYIYNIIKIQATIEFASSLICSYKNVNNEQISMITHK